MAIRVALHHHTEYRYDRLVNVEPHVVRLRPAPHCRTPILSYSLKVLPEPHFLNWQQDAYSNYAARLIFLKPAREITFTVDLVAELVSTNPFDFFVESAAEKFPFRYDDIAARELLPYLEKQPAEGKLAELIRETQLTGLNTIDFVVAINHKVNSLIRYVIRMEPGIQAVEQTLSLGSGSCRDSAWLLVQLMRHHGLAARFVSGYLIQLTADVKSLDGPSGPEQDFTDLHAWAEVYLPGAGWVGLDPTSGLLAGEGHIPLACAADPITAAPITGTYSWTKLPDKPDDKCREDFRFEMSVKRIHEDPRVTKPYTDRQWKSIESLGNDIDGLLRAGDVRLTMGGEPTFVGIDNRDADEWNTAALGPHKRERAGVLFRRMRDRFASGALLHFGQGKWYPGESLPRWALGCYWRKDGQPLWKNPELIAEDGHDYQAGPADAAKFVQLLATKLGVDPGLAMPGYEDAFYYLWRERRLPTNVDPLKSKLDNKEDRARLAKIFDRGLDKIIGYAMPLQRVHTSAGSYWVSGKWFLRSEHLFLIPGDSPMGYRLPLDSLPWSDASDREELATRDPFDRPGPLPPRPDYSSAWLASAAQLPASIGLQSAVVGGPLEPTLQSPLALGNRKPVTGLRSSPPVTPAPVGQSQAGVIRTTLCVEARGGTLFVFMPPAGHLEDYLDLVAAVEATAAELSLPIQLEGYSPPHDHRLQHFKVTPDPGVIEVNIHAAGSWDEIVENTKAVYEEAHYSRLSTEKFMLDGRHSGTGGGNHIVLGGPTAGDSPLLRRPDLLRSLVSYWHNHPSLSYLFSGMFLGPTSQAPRVDEARNDALYELEIAFQQVPDASHVRPWMVDRIFRHLLVDLTGNTHRAEFCIDKMYSPDTAEGRRGLLEFRGFEMPPHWQMSLVQQMLLRSFVARFWHQPYQAKLVRWGTELHDRFMLPHFIQQDFQDVLFEMRQAGLPFQEAWFAPHFEFRFPQFGHITQRGVNLELRQAVEPWHVLGEEAAGSGTARYVDSSVERVQVKVTGLTDTRHIVAVNGRRVPLHPTGINGEFVAGVRYRAWQPPSCLHPTIGVHAPLVFDILDTWMGRSLGGCSYHVAHPGGRAHDTFPVNANEAEGRRLSRFFTFGHTPGPITVPPEVHSAECPLTLDLRQSPAESSQGPPLVIAPANAAADTTYRGNGAPKPHASRLVEREHSFS